MDPPRFGEANHLGLDVEPQLIVFPLFHVAKSKSVVLKGGKVIDQLYFSIGDTRIS